jgi:hypothetical protein
MIVSETIWQRTIAVLVSDPIPFEGKWVLSEHLCIICICEARTKTSSPSASSPSASSPSSSYGSENLFL